MGTKLTRAGGMRLRCACKIGVGLRRSALINTEAVVGIAIIERGVFKESVGVRSRTLNGGLIHLLSRTYQASVIERDVTRYMKLV